MSIADELAKLDALRHSNAITEDEYQKLKNDLIQRQQGAVAGPMSIDDENTWAMFLHLSQLCGYITFGLGLAVPIILWQLKCKESAAIDRHGRIVANWMITALIMGAIFTVLSFVLIGIPLLVCLGIIAIVFPIIGGLKAKNGEFWPYPMSFKFL